MRLPHSAAVCGTTVYSNRTCPLELDQWHFPTGLNLFVFKFFLEGLKRKDVSMPSNGVLQHLGKLRRPFNVS